MGKNKQIAPGHVVNRKLIQKKRKWSIGPNGKTTSKVVTVSRDVNMAFGTVPLSDHSLVHTTDPFTPFQEVTKNEAFIPSERLGEPDKLLNSLFGEGGRRAYLNSLYLVFVETIPGPQGDSMSLSIRNTARTNHFPWRDLQRIKNELAGPEREAVEMFPAESRLVDTDDRRYLFVLPEGMQIPYGFQERLLIEEIGGAGSQTPFGPFNRPADIKTLDEALAMQGLTPERETHV